MHIQVITIAAGGVSMETCETLCRECAAICDRLAGVRASEWQVNRDTHTIAGMMKWSEAAAIAIGTETLRLQVAQLTDAPCIFSCRTIPCPAPRPTPVETEARPNLGCVRYPPGYDPRG